MPYLLLPYMTHICSTLYEVRYTSKQGRLHMKSREMMHFMTASDGLYLLAAGWPQLGSDIKSIQLSMPVTDYTDALTPGQYLEAMVTGFSTNATLMGLYQNVLVSACLLRTPFWSLSPDYACGQCPCTDDSASTLQCQLVMSLPHTVLTVQIYNRDSGTTCFQVFGDPSTAPHGHNWVISYVSPHKGQTCKLLQYIYFYYHIFYKYIQQPLDTKLLYL